MAMTAALLAGAKMEDPRANEHSFVLKGASDILVTDGAQVCTLNVLQNALILCGLNKFIPRMDRLLPTTFCAFARAAQARNPSPPSELPFNREAL